MAQIQSGCCEAKTAVEIANVASTLSVDNRESIEKLFPLACCALLIAIVSFAVGALTAGKTDERLLRLEKIVGIDDIGRRK